MKAWLLTLQVFAVFSCVAWTFGLASGLYRFEPRLDWDLARLALVAFFVPAIGEELVFRAALVPTKAEQPSALLHCGLALLVFLAWHPFNAWAFFPEVLPYFSDPRFLAVTALLGLTCTYLWRATASIWPPIVVHWLAVVAWKAFLGAPRML